MWSAQSYMRHWYHSLTPRVREEKKGKKKILRVMVKRKQIQNPVLLMWRDHYTHEFTAAILSAQEIYKLKPTIIPSWIKERLIRPYPCLKVGWVFDGRIWYVEEEDWGMCMTKIHCMHVWSFQVINEAILKSNNKLIKVFISYLNVCLKYKNVSACTLCMHMSWKSATLCCLRSTNYSYSVWVPLFFCFCPSAMLATLNSYCPLHYPT